MNIHHYITCCPVGHPSILRYTTVELREGVLRCCSTCQQLISSCSKETYETTMQQFNTALGTLPSGKAIKRAFKNFKSRLQLIEQHLNKSSHNIKLLDLGCSSGAFLEVARQLGFQAEGLEPAYKAAMTAKEKGLTVHIGTIEEDSLPENSFDVITLFEVIEHIADPVRMLKHCYRILKPGGIIMIGTGNTHSWTAKIMKKRWDYYDMQKHGGHISFFNKYSIQLLGKMCHLNTIYLKTRAIKFYEKEELSKPLYRITKLCSEIISVFTKWFNVGHDMLTIFQK